VEIHKGRSFSSRFLKLFLIISITSIFSTMSIPAFGIDQSLADFYVAPNGSDSNPGTQEKPFATIQCARDAVRGKIAKGMGRDVEVVLRGGKYFIDDTIRFDQRDSGLDGYSVVYKGAKGEQAIVYGGKRINGWEKVSDNIYRAKVEKGKRFFRLFQNDSSLVMARHPNKGSGYGGGLEVVDNTTITFPKSWSSYDFSDAQLFGFIGANWFSEMREVIAVDRDSRTLTVDPGAEAFGGLNERVYIQGVKEFLDEPGEWCLNHKQGYVYCWPYSGDIEEQIIVAPISERVLDIRSDTIDKPVSNISFENITFIGSDFCKSWRIFDENKGEGNGMMHEQVEHGLIYIENGENINVRFCKILGAGHSGVLLNRYAQNCSVYGCWIEDAGYVGVNLTGWDFGQGPFASPEESYVNKNNTISNNFIYDCGAFVGHGCGVYSIQSGDNTISHNVIAFMPRYGIAFKGRRYGHIFGGLIFYGRKVDFQNQFDFNHGRNNLVAYNDISNVCRDSFDYGAIESWGSGRDNVWRNNAIHDLDPSVDWDGWAHAIFPDDSTHHLAVRDNIVYNCQGGNMTGVIMAKNIELLVENNIFADNMTGRIATVSPYIEPAYDMVIRGNIIAGEYDKLWSTNVNTFKPHFEEPKLTEGSLIVKEIDYNLYAQPHPELGKYKDHKWDVHSLQDNPKFKRKNPSWDTHYTDFELEANSPAFNLGFKPIDISKIGLRDDFPFDRSMFFRKQASEKLQTENYNRMKGLRTKGGAGINQIVPGAWAKYENVDFGNGTLNEFIAEISYKPYAGTSLQDSAEIKNYVTHWQLSEVFSGDGKNGTEQFRIAYTPEIGQSRTDQWRWQEGPTTDRAGQTSPPGVVDLGHILGEDKVNCVAYLTAYVHSQVDQKSLLETGSSHGLKIWLNDKQVYARNTSQELVTDQDKISVRLQAGWNKIMLKVVQNSGQWAAAARFMTEDGKEHLSGLRIKTSQSEELGDTAGSNTITCSIRLDSPEGKIIGQLMNNQTVARVKPVKGTHTLYLVFENNHVDLMDWFRFR
jgi:hypothetical protein